MTTLAVPTATPVRRPARKLWVWLIPVVAAAAAASGYLGYTAWGSNRAAAAASANKFYTVTAGEMQVKVHKDGELTSVNNTEIMSLVEGISTIVQIVKEGALVNAGDVLVQLDSSAIRQKI